MADTLELEIVTPDKLLVHERVDGVQIPGKNGELGILPGHAPLITTLTIGEMSYRQSTIPTTLRSRGDSPRCCRTR